MNPENNGNNEDLWRGLMDSHIYKVVDHFTGEPIKPEGMELIQLPDPYTFECESISFKKLLTLHTDTLLDLYIDYHTLYELTGDTKAEARAKVYQQALRTKSKLKEGVS